MRIVLDPGENLRHSFSGMITFNTDEAESQLVALLDAVEDHNEVVVICRHGKPVAELRGVADPDKAAVTGEARVINPLQPHSELAAKILYHPMEPAEFPYHQKESPRSIREFFGCFDSGDPHGADNERIDTDLAREAAGEL